MSTKPHQPLAKSLGLGLLTLALLVGGFLLPACSAQEGSAEGVGGGQALNDSDVLATVNGQDITVADVREQAGNQLEQVEAQLVQCQTNYERNRYQALESGVQQVIENQLLEAEAEKRGISKEDLVAAEVDATIQPVTDEEAQGWFQENQARLRGTYEQLGPQIKNYLENQRKQQAHDDFINSLKKGVKVAYNLEPPRVQVDADGFPAKGPADAPVTIVEFSDFQCPFCARVVPTLEQVKEKYGDKVRLVYRHFPLGMHPNAPKAAEAAMCAEEQGKFWEMHDLMFEEQQQLAVADLKAKAERLELDTDQFNQCLDSGKYKAEVQADMQAGQRAGVTGTPAMFINGRLVSGAVPVEQVEEVIDNELSRAGVDSGSASSSGTSSSE
jgi:protein-disulfide isomerase